MPLHNPSNLVQTISTKLASNITKSNNGNTTILTINITTDGGNLITMASATSSNSSTTAVNLFQISLDGKAITFAGAGNDGGALSGSNIQHTCFLLGYSTGVSAGSHTITLDWARSTGTARINASSGTNDEQAVLSVIETWV